MFIWEVFRGFLLIGRVEAISVGRAVFFIKGI